MIDKLNENSIRMANVKDFQTEEPPKEITKETVGQWMVTQVLKIKIFSISYIYFYKRRCLLVSPFHNQTESVCAFTFQARTVCVFKDRT